MIMNIHDHVIDISIKLVHKKAAPNKMTKQVNTVVACCCGYSTFVSRHLLMDERNR